MTKVALTLEARPNTPTPSPSPTAAPTRTATRPPRRDPGLIITLGEEVPIPHVHSRIAFSPDGRTVVLASDRIRMWDLSTYDLVREFYDPQPDACQPADASFSPDGSLFALTLACWSNEEDPSRLLVWDAASGNVVGSWTLARAAMSAPGHGPYSIPTAALVFLPNSQRIAVSNGHTIELIDPLVTHAAAATFDLGPRMYASQLSIRADGKFLYALMTWDELNTFPALYTTEFRIQIWGLETNDLRRQVELPEVDYPAEGMLLNADTLIHYFYEEARAEAVNLSTDATSRFLFRRGWQFLSQDLQFLLVARYVGFDPEDQVMELWDVDTWSTLYTFTPDFPDNWYIGITDVQFTPDNTKVAIAHSERLTLWQIRSIVVR